MRVFFSNVLYLVAAILLILPMGRAITSAYRAKRAIAFRKGSTFFYRLNYKIASIPSSTIFAQATGFKVAWKLPSSDMRRRRSVNEIHESAELLYESYGFDGGACVRKNICQAMDHIDEQEQGVLVKIMKLLIDTSNDNGTAFDRNTCKEHSLRCPLELIGINGLIDTTDR